MTELSNRQVRIGKVVKCADDKTVTVLVSNFTRHKKYDKVITKSKKYLTHVDRVIPEFGDEVEIQSCRPISRRKTWRVSKIVKKFKPLVETN